MKNILIILFVFLITGANAQIYGFKITGMHGHDNRSGKDTDFVIIEEPTYFTLDLLKSQYIDFDKETHQKRVSSYFDFYSGESQYDVYISFKIAHTEMVEIILDKDKMLLRHHYGLENVVINYVIDSIKNYTAENN
ncbi:MAG: hypothetical protein JXL97_02410 [Bacteroidales bacterium]|nr:hypothetical protein [Bacteroidales bacterium]